MLDQPSGKKPLLLLVEDEPDTASLVTLIMEGKGYQVLHTPDGADALEKIALMPPPSLALLDIQLPNVDGVTILETIRATPDWQDVPVIMLTAVAEEHRIRKVLSLTVQGYVLKPFKQETLVSCVEQARMRLPRPC
jgi:CheY-like chemotaxis protein